VGILETDKPQKVTSGVCLFQETTVFESPIEDFLQAARQAGLGERVHFLKHGESYQF
jgi:hypothetical protein